MVDNKKIRVRCPVMSKQELIDWAVKFTTKGGPFHKQKTLGQALDFFIECRERDINDQLIEIEKCKKRIQRSKKSSQNALEAFNEVTEHERE